MVEGEVGESWNWKRIELEMDGGLERSGLKARPVEEKG